MAVVLGGAIVLGGCGGDGGTPGAGGSAGASRPGLPSFSPSRTGGLVPSGSIAPPTRSTAPPAEPTTAPTSTTPAQPTSRPTTTSPAQPTSGPTRTAPVQPTSPPTSQPTSQPTTPTASATGSDTAEVTVTEDDSSSVTQWWPLALLVLLVLAALGVWAWVRSNRRKKWDTALATTSGDCRWAVSTLAPSLVNRSAPVADVSAQWLDGQRRIDEAHLALAELGSTAPTPERAAQAAALTNALDGLRQSLSADVALRTVSTGDPATDFGLVTSSQAVERSRQTMLSALGPAPAPA